MEAHGDLRPPASRVARNTALRAAAEITGKLASVVLFAFIARELGQGTLGEFVFALALTQIVWSLAGFGLDRMALRDIARERGPAIDRLFFDVTALKLSAGLVGVTLATIGVALVGYPGRVQALVAVLGLALVLVLLSSTAQTVFQAYERMEYYFYAAVPNKLLAAVFGIGVLVAGGGIVAVAVGNLVAAAIGLVLATAIMYGRFARPQVRVRPAGWARLVRDGAPFGLQEMLGQIIFRTDILVLALLTTTAVVGEYGAGFRVIEATLFLAWSVGNSVLPMYSYLQRDGDPPLGRVFEGSLKFVAVIMVPAAVILLVCAEPIVDLLYGLPAYEGTVPVLRWLSFAIVAYAIGHLAGILVLVRRPGRLTVAAMGVVALTKLMMTLALASGFGAEGAAAATLAAELLLAGISLWLARPEVGLPSLRRVALPPLVAGAAMASAMLPFADKLELALPAGLVAYVLVLVAVEARSLSGDLATVRSMFGGRPATAPLGERMAP